MSVEGMTAINKQRPSGVPTTRSRLRPLARRALPNDPAALARWLIGKRVVRASRTLMVGRIVETEAYLADDPASHSFRGETRRNASMFRAKGHAYIYRIYGMWFCLNVSAGAEGHGAAVLVRALEPEQGIEHMQSRRGGARERGLMRGPGRLCAALDIGAGLDGVDLCDENGKVWLAPGKASSDIAVGPRVGITKGADWPLRFYERGSAYVSGKTSERA